MEGSKHAIEKEPIKTVDELYQILPDELKNHVSENENDLPDMTIENLKEELSKAIQQRESKTGYFAEGEDRKNYVPAYWDIGLISRACSAAEKAGYKLDPIFDGLNY